jgi:Na+/H+ antiporter NhaD/arsenite permease-like protein
LDLLVEEEKQHFTKNGIFCLLRVTVATLFCALESVHGLPVYLVILIMGAASVVLDFLTDTAFAKDTLRHMPWELFAFVTAFLVLAEAMAVTGISLTFAGVFLPFVESRSVAFVSGFTTMLACNLFETIPATLIVFKMIDTVPQWRADFIEAAGPATGPLLRDARRAALSAVIFGSNFGANTACIGSLGGLMMRRLAEQQGVIVTNGMLLKQGLPVMIPVMCVACFVLISQDSI